MRISVNPKADVEGDKGSRRLRRVQPAPRTSLPLPALRVLLAARKVFLDAVRKQLQNPSDAEDVLQEGYLKALQSRMEFRGEASTVAWFRRLLRNVTVDHIRHCDAEMRAHAGLASDAETSDPAGDWSAARRLRHVIDDLPEMYAYTLRRIDLDEAAVRDVARELGVTTNNLRVRLHRARRVLKGKVLASRRAAENRL